MNYWELPEHALLTKASSTLCGQIGEPALGIMLADPTRLSSLILTEGNMTLDCTRCLVDDNLLSLLSKVCQGTGVYDKIAAMYAGEKINATENRAVGHVALRSTKPFMVDGCDVVPEVQRVRQDVYKFAECVHSGSAKGCTGKALKDIVCIGIGGSYLGVEFVHEAVRHSPEAKSHSAGKRLRFLANVDPIDVARALEDLDPASTLVVVISKTLTTAETMMNARTVKRWLQCALGDKGLDKHMCAVSTNVSGCEAFGITKDRVFGFCDWVGGRYSVCSPVGVLPLALIYGSKVVDAFLSGARNVDECVSDGLNSGKMTIPMMMAWMSWLNSTYHGFGSVAILPYCQALHRFPAHIQQLTMESNGKRVTLGGVELPDGSKAEVFFGEPGTNGQHSFYQLIHQGRIVPAEFIGFVKSQNEIRGEGESVSNHDELMSNFFAQPDALAYGKSKEALITEKVPEALLSHKTFPGGRPSMCLLFDGCLSAYECGQLLSIYEHRTAIEGFMWGINPFDQWGVELGKVLANNIREIIKTKVHVKPGGSVSHATAKLLNKYNHK